MGTERTVLLAEDDVVVREMVARVLERRGCRVLLASDGLDAVSTFREHHTCVDIVVLDVRMPNLGGPEALLRMRSLRPSLAAILVSGFVPSGLDLATFFASGVRFVQKPFRVTGLAALICEMVPAPR